MILRIQSSFDFLKILFENENFYFGNWNIISEIMLKIKISFNVWSAHLRNWDFHFGNHFEKVRFGDGNLDFSSQNSHFENFSWKLKFDLKVQNAYFGNHSLVKWVIKNFILIVKRWFQSFHFRLLTLVESYQSIMTLISPHQFASTGWFLRRGH